jgi:hypothetical protein
MSALLVGHSVCGRWSRLIHDSAPGRARGGASENRRPPRTLPFRVTPVLGEDLESWLEALANRFDISWGELLRAVGLPCPNLRSRFHPCAYGLTEMQLDSVSRAAGVAVPALREMTWASFFSALPQRTASELRSFVMPRSRFCPRCLRDNGGRWLLWWRLRLAFACPLHQCLLVDVCPRCARPQRIARSPADFVPLPGRCSRRAWDADRGRDQKPCAAVLADSPVVDLPSGDSALVAQREALALVCAGSVSTGIYEDAPARLVEFAADISGLGGSLLRYGSPTALPGQVSFQIWRCYENLCRTIANDARTASPPWALGRNTTGAVATAAGVCLALPILTHSTATAAAQTIHELISTDGPSQPIPSLARYVDGAPTSTALRALLHRSPTRLRGPVALLRRHKSVEGRRAPAIPPRRWRAVPALAWPQWALPLSTCGVGFARLRAALSVSLLVVGSDLDLAQACAELGSVSSPPDVTRVLQVLRAHPDGRDSLAVVTDLADQLEERCCPIDYQRRRRLSFLDLLPESQWQQVCRATATPVGRSVKMVLHRCWLYERLTGSPAQEGPFAFDSPKFRSALAELPRTLTPDLVGALDGAGRMFLDSHGLGHEPLRWQPEPGSHSSAVHGMCWEKVDIGTLHRLIGEQGVTLTVAARTCHTSIGVIRELLNEWPAPHPRPLHATGGL